LDLITLWRHVPPHRRRQLLFIALLMPATAVMELAMVGSLIPLLALLANQPPRSFDLEWLNRLQDAAIAAAGDPLMAAALLFIIAAIVTAALRLALAWQSERFAYGWGHELALEVQRRLLHQPYLFHVARHSSELIAALDKVEHLALNLVLHLIQAVSAVLIGAFVLLLLFDLDAVSAALAAVLILGLYAIALGSVRSRLVEYTRVIGSGYELRLQSVQESLGSIRDIILDRSHDAHLARFAKIDERFMRARSNTAMLASAPRFLVETVGLVLIAMLAVFLASRPGGVMAALPVLGALALGAQRLLPLASQLFGGWASLSITRPFLRDVAKLLDLPIIPDDRAPAPWVFTQSIRFENVAFRYPDRVHHAVHDLNLTIARGKRVALVGPTGSGKSTLADLLMGLIEPDAGTIMIDGVPLSHDCLPEWRAAVAHVPQAIFLADDSIARNIALVVPDKEPDMARVRKAADLAQLGSFIDGLPDRYDTRIGERGIRLSGGQRQRLALARAIYKDAPLLVLDEATSALDDVTEAAVLAALDELMIEGRSIVIIAHRLSTIAKCDLVYQLEGGTITRSGTFADVFGQPDSLPETEL
jgi:ABC-type multidrug transport system fused ATPase/permease subunit